MNQRNFGHACRPTAQSRAFVAQRPRCSEEARIGNESGLHEQAGAFYSSFGEGGFLKSRIELHIDSYAPAEKRDVYELRGRRSDLSPFHVIGTRGPGRYRLRHAGVRPGNRQDATRTRAAPCRARRAVDR